MARPYLHQSAPTAWQIADANKKKAHKYADLSESVSIFICVSIGVKIIGSISKGSQRILKDLAKRMEANVGDPQEGNYHTYLRQLTQD